MHCPFCGFDNKHCIAQPHEDKKVIAYVICDSCNAHGPKMTVMMKDPDNQDEVQEVLDMAYNQWKSRKTPHMWITNDQ